MSCEEVWRRKSCFLFLIFGCDCSRFGEEKAVVGKKKLFFVLVFNFLAVFVADLKKKRRWLVEKELSLDVVVASLKNNKWFFRKEAFLKITDISEIK